MHSPACWRGLALRAGGGGKTTREYARHSSGFSPSFPPSRPARPLLLQGFTSRCSTGSAGSDGFSLVLDRHHRTRLAPLGAVKAAGDLTICNYEQLGQLGLTTRAHAPPRPFPSARHSLAAGNGHHEVQYRPVHPVTGPGLQLARCPSGQSSDEFSSFLRRPMANESCWRAASLDDGVVAASFQNQSQCQRVALCLSIMHPRLQT